MNRVAPRRTARRIAWWASWATLAVISALLVWTYSRDGATTATELFGRALELNEAGNIAASSDALKAVLVREPDHVEARRMLGRIYLDLNNPRAAEKELQRAQTLGANDPELAVELLRAKLGLGKYAEVIDATRESDDPVMQVLRGTARMRSGLDREAISDFVLALRADQDQFEAEVGLAQIAITMRDAWLAEFHIDRAFAIENEEPGIWRERIRLDLGQMRFEAAKDDCNTAHRFVPLDPSVLAECAHTALLLKEYDEVAAWLKKLETRLPGSNHAAFVRALMDFEQGRGDAAKTLARDVLRRSPEHVQSMFLLAVILFEGGSTAQAEDLLVAFARRNPGYVPAQSLLARIRRAHTTTDAGAGDSARAGVKPLDDGERLALLGVVPLAPRGPEDAGQVIRRAARYIDLGFVHGALDLLERAYESDAENVEILILLGRAYTRASDRRAREMARRAYELAPSHVGALHDMGWVLINEGEPERGLELLDKAGELGLDSAHLHYHRGSALIRLGRVDEAVAALKKALSTDPHFSDSQNAFNLLAEGYRTYANRGEIEKAVQILEHVAGLYEPSANLLNLLALAYSAIEDPRALNLARRANLMAPDDPEIMHTYGWLLTASDDPAAGLDLMGTAIAMGVDSPSIHYHRGVALAKLGSEFKSVLALEKALHGNAQFSEREDAEKLLGQLRQVKSETENRR